MTVLSPTPRDNAEAAILGSVLLTDKALHTITDEHLQPHHLTRPHHQALLRAMLHLHDQGRQVDQLTLKAHFDSPQSPVSPADIELLAGSVVNLSSLREYCRIVKQGHWFDGARRALWDAGDALDQHDQEAVLAAVARIDHEPTPGEDVDAATEFMRWYDSEQKGWQLPFAALNEAIGGTLAPGEPTVLGGWSGMGKSFLLAQILRHCVKAGARVHEFASEMHGPKRTARTLTAMTGIPAGLIERRRLSPDQLRTVIAALKGLPYETTATAGWRPEDYCRAIRRGKWDVAAIDTVTNLPCSRVDEWDRACGMLADAAAQAGTHLIEVCQLNLERDKGKKPPPVGRDLRNTGAWYQRARVVLFVHRDQERREAGDGAELWEAASEGHVRVEKATHGDASRGFVAVRFNEKWLRFDELRSYGSLGAVA